MEVSFLFGLISRYFRLFRELSSKNRAILGGQLRLGVRQRQKPQLQKLRLGIRQHSLKRMTRQLIGG